MFMNISLGALIVYLNIILLNFNSLHMDFGIMGGAGAPNEPKLLYVSLKRK